MIVLQVTFDWHWMREKVLAGDRFRTHDIWLKHDLHCSHSVHFHFFHMNLTCTNCLWGILAFNGFRLVHQKHPPVGLPRACTIKKAIQILFFKEKLKK